MVASFFYYPNYYPNNYPNNFSFLGGGYYLILQQLKQTTGGKFAPLLGGGKDLEANQEPEAH